MIPRNMREFFGPRVAIWNHLTGAGIGIYDRCSSLYWFVSGELYCSSATGRVLVESVGSETRWLRVGGCFLIIHLLGPSSSFRIGKQEYWILLATLVTISSCFRFSSTKICWFLVMTNPIQICSDDHPNHLGWKKCMELLLFHDEARAALTILRDLRDGADPLPMRLGIATGARLNAINRVKERYRCRSESYSMWTSHPSSSQHWNN